MNNTNTNDPRVRHDQVHAVWKTSRSDYKHDRISIYHIDRAALEDKPARRTIYVHTDVTRYSLTPAEAAQLAEALADAVEYDA
jgi:hypothetical protein